jgi:hypothetical protein
LPPVISWRHISNVRMLQFSMPSSPPMVTHAHHGPSVAFAGQRSTENIAIAAATNNIVRIESSSICRIVAVARIMRPVFAPVAVVDPPGSYS